MLLREAHDAPAAGHLGRARTLERLDRHFIWPGMTRDAREYVRTCDICQRTKMETHQPRGLLHPLPVPDGKWTHITMDLVTLFARDTKGIRRSRSLHGPLHKDGPVCANNHHSNGTTIGKDIRGASIQEFRTTKTNRQ